MGRNRNLRTNTTFNSKEYNFSSPSERDAFLVAAGSGGGAGSAFDVKGTQASAAVTFTGVPADGDTLVITGGDGGRNGTVIATITFTNTLNTTDAYRNDDQILLTGIATAADAATALKNFLGQWFYTTTANHVRGSYLCCSGTVNALDNTTVDVVYDYPGEDGNDVTISTTSSAITLPSSNFSGGSATYDTSNNETVKVVLYELEGAGTVFYWYGLDPETGLPRVTNDDRESSIAGFNVSRINPFGMLAGTEPGQLFQEGDIVNLVVKGIVPYAIVDASSSTGRHVLSGTTLSVDPSSPGMLSSGKSSMQKVATMLLPSGKNQGNNVVYFNGSMSSMQGSTATDGQAATSSGTRIDGWLNDARLGADNKLVPAGSLVCFQGSPISEGFPQVEIYDPVVHGHTSVDIIGLMANDYTDYGNFDSSISGNGVTITDIITSGIAGGVRIYDAAGVQILSNSITVGTVIYAGDGTNNPTATLTTDPTSGVAIGRVLGSHPNYFRLTDGDPDEHLYKVLIEPSRWI